MAFSATDSAMEGFRLARRKPGVLFIWALYLIVTVVVLGVAFFSVAGPGLTQFAQESRSPTIDPATMFARMAPIFGGVLVAIPIAAVMFTVLVAAVYRAVLRPEQPGLAYLRLGGDELRMIGVMIALFFILAVPYYIAVALVGAASRAIGNGQPSPLVSILGTLVVLCVYIWIRVRMSLALAITVGERKMRVFESWRLTKGRFWPLLGMYLLVVVFAIAAFIVMYILILILALLGFGGMAQLAHPTPESLAAAAPLAIVAGLVAAVIYLVGLTLILTLSYAAQARAYRDLSGGGAAEAF